MTYKNWLKQATHFDSYYDNLSPINYIRRKGIEFRIQTSLRLIPKGKKVLDIGCGSGRLDIELAKRGAEVWGIDISKEVLAIAKLNADKSGVKINFLEGDICDMAIPQADIWVGLGLIEYMPYPLAVFNKLRHIPNLIFSVPIAMSWEIPFRLINRTLIKGIKFHTFRKKQLINMLNEVGYKEVSFIPYYKTGWLVHNL